MVVLKWASSEAEKQSAVVVVANKRCPVCWSRSVTCKARMSDEQQPALVGVGTPG